MFAAYNTNLGDPEVAKSFNELLAMERRRDRLWWRVIGGVVSLATVTSAVVAVLSVMYLRCGN